MHVLVAPDKFKGSLTAARAAQALAAGLTESAGVTAKVLPIADGGDGTVAAFRAAGWWPVEVALPGHTATYVRRGRTAVIELAQVCGLDRHGTSNPLGASTFEFGTVIGHAIRNGARQIMLGLGGSASTDGGAGMMAALGARIRGQDGAPLPLGGAALVNAVTLEPPAIPNDVEFLIASDVDNPLLGPHGSAVTYGPQKGAGPEDVVRLEAAMENWAELVASVTGVNASSLPGAGAAGGTGFAALALLSASQRPGIEVVLELLRFSSELVKADWVITGEGRFDEQTLRGKGPMGVCTAARAAGVPVTVVAGQVSISENQMREAGFTDAHALSGLEPDPAKAMANAEALLTRIGVRLGAQLGLSR